MIAERYERAVEEHADLHAVTDRLERALLGAVLTVGLLPKAPPRVEDFVTEAHRVAWAAILAVVARGDAPVLVTVMYAIGTEEQVQRAGGHAYLSGCMDSCDCSEIAVYARLVREASSLRRAQRVKGA